MTMTTAARNTASRRLLLSSLALNFFFIGIIGAFATRFHFAAIHPTGRPHTAAARIEWLAERLGPADAEKLRIAFHPRETEAEHTREAVGRAYERLRETLRAEPFDSGALRTTMAEVRAVRLIYEQTVHEIVIAAVPTLSHEGRIALAN